VPVTSLHVIFTCINRTKKQLIQAAVQILHDNANSSRFHLNNFSISHIPDFKNIAAQNNTENNRGTKNVQKCGKIMAAESVVEFRLTEIQYINLKKLINYIIFNSRQKILTLIVVLYL